MSEIRLFTVLLGMCVDHGTYIRWYFRTRCARMKETGFLEIFINFENAIDLN